MAKEAAPWEEAVVGVRPGESVLGGVGVSLIVPQIALAGVGAPVWVPWAEAVLGVRLGLPGLVVLIAVWLCVEACSRHARGCGWLGRGTSCFCVFCLSVWFFF